MPPDELRAWREERGLSQERLAHILGVSLLAYGNWERGKHKPPPYLYYALVGYEHVEEWKPYEARRSR